MPSRMTPIGAVQEDTNRGTRMVVVTRLGLHGVWRGMCWTDGRMDDTKVHPPPRVGGVRYLQAGLAETVISTLANWPSPQIPRYGAKLALTPGNFDVRKF